MDVEPRVKNAFEDVETLVRRAQADAKGKPAAKKR
jgi:hypothetical protein